MANKPIIEGENVPISLSQTGVMATAIVMAASAAAQSPPAQEYRIYAGSSHAHTAFTWSHGDMLAENACKGVVTYALKEGSDVLFEWRGGDKSAPCPVMYVMNGWQYHSQFKSLKPDWQRFQGPPSAHFAAARAAGFDWYATTDHSQEAAYFPLGPDNPQWRLMKDQATEATRAGFVGLAGFEYSENDGPGGTGHINVINTDDISNALIPGVDLAAFYRWLAKAKPNGAGPVIATFNHPSVDSHAHFTGRTAAATEIIAMLEVVNGNGRTHYPGFIAALDAGWKVSPTVGLDNHGLAPIATFKPRAFVLAKAATKEAILDAMRHRRTYASLDNNIQARYTVNGQVMGSTLPRPAAFRFDIAVEDPDTNDPRARITKLDIVKDGGQVVASFTPDAPSTRVRWQPEVRDAAAHYFFVRVWSAGGGDAPKADPDKPVAWLAPVWTGLPGPMAPMLPPDQAGEKDKAGN